MSTSQSSSSGGMGICSTLFVVFLILKLTGVIAWSWFWILSPLIFGIILAVFFIVVILGIMKVQDGENLGVVSFFKTRYSSIQQKIKVRKSEKNLKWAEDFARKREELAQDIEHRFEIMDVEEGSFKAKVVTPISYGKVVPKPKKPHFSLKTWWADGNKKAAKKKAAKKLAKKQKKT